MTSNDFNHEFEFEKSKTESKVDPHFNTPNLNENLGSKNGERSTIE